MRTTKAALLQLLLTLGAGVPLAQGQGPVSGEEATVRSLEERGRLGVLNRDTLSLEQVWSEHFMVNAPSNRVAPSRRVVFALLGQGMIHYSSFETTIEHLRVDGDIAIVMGGETVRPTGKAPLAGQIVKRRFTHIWQKQNGSWLLMVRHANVIPSRAVGRAGGTKVGR